MITLTCAVVVVAGSSAAVQCVVRYLYSPCTTYPLGVAKSIPFFYQMLPTFLS
jgi:hypothetical protein